MMGVSIAGTNFRHSLGHATYRVTSSRVVRIPFQILESTFLFQDQRLRKVEMVFWRDECEQCPLSLNSIHP